PNCEQTENVAVRAEPLRGEARAESIWRSQVGPALAPVPAGGIDDPLAELLARDHLGEARALDLTAGGLGNGARPHEEHAGGAVAAAVVNALDDLADEAAQRLPIVGPLAHFRHHVQALASRALALDAHRGGVAHARDVIHDLLHVGGNDVRATQDDQVLEAARDEEEALAIEESQIARAEPAVGR